MNTMTDIVVIYPKVFIIKIIIIESVLYNSKELTFLGWTDSQGCSFIWSIWSQILASSDQTPFKSWSSSKATCKRSSVALSIPSVQI